MDNRTIVTIVLEKGEVYKTENFISKIYCGDPVNVCAIFSDLGVDEILLIDKSASTSGIDRKLLNAVMSDCFVPISYCGGAITRSDFEYLINVGFDRVGFNLNRYEQSVDVIRFALERYGKQSLFGILSYDERHYKEQKDCYNDVLELLNKCDVENFAEIIFQSIARDGTGVGLDTDIIDTLAPLKISNVVLAGGARSSSEVRSIKENLGISLGVSELATLYKRKGVLLQCP